MIMSKHHRGSTFTKSKLHNFPSRNLSFTDRSVCDVKNALDLVLCIQQSDSEQFAILQHREMVNPELPNG